MKQLTKEQVTANIQRIFADHSGKNGICAIANGGFYLLNFSERGMIAIDDKQVFVKWPGKEHLIKVQEYQYDCQRRNLMVIKRQYLGMEFIPFIWYKKSADESTLKQHDQFLESVGIIKTKKPESDLTRIQQIGGKDYVNFYKLIQQVTVIDAYLEKKLPTDRRKEEIEVLTIEHTTGKFCFPIIGQTFSEYNQVANIFFNLLGMSATTKLSKAA
jgi:hypothetical protein